MKADLIPLIVGSIVFLSSLISLKLGLSVTIIEIILGAAAKTGHIGHPFFGFQAEVPGGIFLTSLAGTEIDTRSMKHQQDSQTRI